VAILVGEGKYITPKIWLHPLNNLEILVLQNGLKIGQVAPFLWLIKGASKKNLHFAAALLYLLKVKKRAKSG